MHYGLTRQAAAVERGKVRLVHAVLSCSCAVLVLFLCCFYAVLVLCLRYFVLFLRYFCAKQNAFGQVRAGEATSVADSGSNNDQADPAEVHHFFTLF